METTKTDPALEKHYRHLSLHPIDTELSKMSEEFQLKEENRKAIEEEKSTYRKLRLFADTLRQQYEQEQTAFTLKLSDAENHQAQLKTTYENQIATLHTQSSDRLLQYAITTALAHKPFAAPAADTPMMINTARTLLDEALQQKNLKVILDDTHVLTLVSITDNKPYTENERPVSFGDFSDALLAARTMLRTTRPASATGTTLPASLTLSRQANHAAVAEIETLLAALEAK